ncbi:MAG TPA: protocatechuate 3,4-dioxygenase subunit alpha [Myxococcales bacterium]|jgi:protocatechuate 3,4-dioxygenase alpha subunit|nr:protocatechuate 3,4-dioxygenase subunit alpha [Myxococcales bacterium]
MDATASQTVGPFFRIGLSWLNGTGTGSATVRGRVIDGLGQPVPDAVLEIWQPGGGFCRVPTDKDGAFCFATSRGTLTVLIFMRGLLRHLMTRIYFPGESDAALGLVPADRRHTLLAREIDGEFVWNVVLQGDDETVFFDF